jgi:hypothetical protein
VAWVNTSFSDVQPDIKDMSRYLNKRRATPFSKKCGNRFMMIATDAEFASKKS